MQLLATIQHLQTQTLSNNSLMTTQLQPQQPSTRDDFIVGNDLTSLLAASADDVQTVLKHLGSVRDSVKLLLHYYY